VNAPVPVANAIPTEAFTPATPPNAATPLPNASVATAFTRPTQANASVTTAFPPATERNAPVTLAFPSVAEANAAVTAAYRNDTKQLQIDMLTVTRGDRKDACEDRLLH
jgi:hypothetical protein